MIACRFARRHGFVTVIGLSGGMFDRLCMLRALVLIALNVAVGSLHFYREGNRLE